MHACLKALHQNVNAASNASVVDVARKKQSPRLYEMN